MGISAGMRYLWLLIINEMIFECDYFPLLIFKFFGLKTCLSDVSFLLNSHRNVSRFLPNSCR